RGISAVVTRYDGNVKALAPKLDLLDGRGAKSVARREDRRMILGLEELGQFGGGGGFAGAIDADDGDDREAGGRAIEGSSPPHPNPLPQWGRGRSSGRREGTLDFLLRNFKDCQAGAALGFVGLS